MNILLPKLSTKAILGILGDNMHLKNLKRNRNMYKIIA